MIADTVQQVPGNLFSNGFAVAIIALLHVQIATFITGGSTIAAVAEGMSMARRSERAERFAHGLLKAMSHVCGLTTSSWSRGRKNHSGVGT